MLEIISKYKCIISVSDLARGLASKVLETIKENNETYVIVKNSKPSAVIISPEEYTDLVEARESLKLLVAPAGQKA